MVLGPLFWGVFICPLVAGIYLEQQQVDRFSTSECTNLVCEQAHEQAKGLSKLALLDEFVSQTVFLLNDLMKNIDGELEKSASSLLRYIHPHCGPTRKILEEVIQKKQTKMVKGTSDLSKGIGPMSDEDLREVEPPGNNDDLGQAYYDKDLTFEDPLDKERKINEEKIDSGYDSFSEHQTSSGAHKNSGDFSSSRDTSHGHHLRKGWSKQEATPTTNSWNSWSGSNRRVYKSQEDGKEGPHGHGPKIYETSEEERAGPSRGLGKTLISKDIEKSDSHREGCRGVNKGSTFWTPGLDSWCKQNCSKGYCPKTHCIC